jgi:hypothetical protein
MQLRAYLLRRYSRMDCNVRCFDGTNIVTLIKREQSKSVSEYLSSPCRLPHLFAVYKPSELYLDSRLSSRVSKE